MSENHPDEKSAHNHMNELRIEANIDCLFDIFHAARDGGIK